MSESSENSQPIARSFNAYLSDIGKGRDGSGGHYRRNVETELQHFLEWAKGLRGPEEWTGIVDDQEDREPCFEDLDESVFREYARYCASSSERDLKQNTVQTYFSYLSAWCGWCVTEGYLDVQYTTRAEARQPLPDDDGRKPGDQQAWTPEQRLALTEHVLSTFENAYDEYTQEEYADPVEEQRARMRVIKAARDRALVYILSYTAVRVGEALRDPSDPRRRGLRWDDLSLDDGSMTVYRKKQQWDSASLPKPVITPLRTYRKLLDPPSDRWPVFPTLSRRTLSEAVQSELRDRGYTDDEIEEARSSYSHDFLLAVDEDIRVQSLTTEGARGAMRRLTEEASVELNGDRDYLEPHGGRRGMGELLVRSFGYTVAARYLDNSEEMVRQRYSHIDAGELGDKAAEGITEIDSVPIPDS